MQWLEQLTYPPFRSNPFQIRLSALIPLSAVNIPLSLFTAVVFSAGRDQLGFGEEKARLSRRIVIGVGRMNRIPLL